MNMFAGPSIFVGHVSDQQFPERPFLWVSAVEGS